MNYRPLFRKLALVPGLVLALAAAAPADQLPRLEADSMGGTHVVLPDAGAGKPLVLLLAFTQESQNDMKSWSKKLLDDHVAGNANIYVVVVADKAVFFARKHVRKLVEGSAVGTQEQMNSNVLITFNGTGWRDLVPPGDKHDAGIVVCDGNGNVVYAKREPYNPQNLADVENAAK